ncbi:MAG: carboxylating nicotinate-nucleotide diphosphorylase [Candidatus Omnitrophica bacterium]|nr:carboxylating nicotinate-nucleotide diphosphorylase [Candidatus Omnitrophota bacterium]
MKNIKKQVDRIIQTAMDEDFVHDDVTTKCLVNKNQISEGYILSRENAVICGSEIVKAVFKKFDPKVKIFIYQKDGAKIKTNEPVIFLKGSTRSILSCERIALNFLGHLSGIATLTNQFVQKIANSKVKILDTRKTTPGLRDLEKYAVRCGEGENHRRDLKAMVLIKDNHLLAKQHHLTFSDVIFQLRRKTKKRIELEVDTLHQFKEALQAKPDIILLDNMTIAQLKHAVNLRNQSGRKILLEASGGVNLKTIVNISKTGIDRISIGQLTHSANSVNFSMEFVK